MRWVSNDYCDVDIRKEEYYSPILCVYAFRANCHFRNKVL